MQTQRMWTTGKSSLHLSPETVLRHLFSSTAERATELVSLPLLYKAAVEAFVSAAR